MNNVKEPLKTVLRKYCHIECYDARLLKEAVSTGRGFPYDIQLFRTQLREAIDMKSISIYEYEQLTEEDFDTQEDLQKWLGELWDDVS